MTALSCSETLVSRTQNLAHSKLHIQKAHAPKSLICVRHLSFHVWTLIQHINIRLAAVSEPVYMLAATCRNLSSVRACMHVFVCACVRACMLACVHTHVHVNAL